LRFSYLLLLTPHLARLTARRSSYLSLTPGGYGIGPTDTPIMPGLLGAGPDSSEASEPLVLARLASA
jgi:hypothetical protein